MSSVLVVDDSEVTHALVKKVLERAGINTVHANSTTKALRLIDQEHFDALVIDIVMPEIDGFQFAQLVRGSAGEQRDVPMIFYSAFLDAHNIERSHAVEPAFLVPKDGNVNQLVDTVRSAITPSGHDTEHQRD